MTDGGAPPPRPLVIGPGWPPTARGGLERYLADLHAAWVDETGRPPQTVVLGPLATPTPGVHAAAGTGAPLLVRLRSVRRLSRRLLADADLVDGHFALTTWPVASVRARDGRPLVTHFHGPWGAEAAAAGASRQTVTSQRFIERRVQRRAAATVAVSGSMARVAVEHAGADPWTLQVIPPGVDLVRFSPADRAAARRSLGLVPDAFVVGCVRRLTARMGVDVLLDAWTMVDAHPAVTAGGRVTTLVVAGDGPLGADLRDQARRVGHDVRFLGAVDDDMLVELYRAADVTVVPSRALEGFGLVALESLACGTPVVVTDVGGLPDAVRGIGPDLVVPAGRADELAERLVGALDGTRPLPDAERCRARAEGFDWRAVVRAHVDLYRRVLGHEPDHRRRVLLVDHTAAPSGGELAASRLVAALPTTHVHAVLFEEGPFEGLLARAGATVEVRPLDDRVRTLRRSQVGRPAASLLATMRTVGFTVGLARRIRRLRPDVVHANSLKAGLIGGVAARLAGVPFVWHVRDRIAPDYLPHAAVRLVRIAADRLPDAVVVPSRTVRATLRPEHEGGPVVAVIADPYSRHEVPTTPAGSAARDGVHVVMVGRLSRWKGQDVFLRALASVVADRDDVRATIVGGSPFDEDDLAAELRALRDELGLSRRVTFAGHVEDVESVLATADVAVHASVLPEPFGQVVVEALAAGVTLIATDAGGPAELLTDGVDALLVRPGDVDDLARALNRLIDDPALRARLATEGRRTARVADPEEVGAVVAALHDEVLKRRYGRRRRGRGRGRR